MSDINDADPAGFVFKPPERWVLERTLVYDNGDYLVRGPGGTNRLKSGTHVWETWDGYLKDANIDPRPVAPPQQGPSWETLDRLYIEAMMETPASRSKVPSSPEIDEMREQIRAEVRQMKADGIMPVIPD